jgi:glucose-1-phosphate adenylyltransferase
MKTRVVILAGGEGSRLGVLTAKRAKPAVPFAGKYRIIDFALSNCVNSGLFDMAILTQYRPHSLNEHIGVGRPWDLDRSFTGGVRIFQPYKGRSDTDWYMGTADALQQNFTFIKEGSPDDVLVLSGDHIYEMNYAKMIAFHRDHQAALTIATLRVSLEDATRMGILATDAEYRVTEFVEKPKNPPGTLASMGIYVFDLQALDEQLRYDAGKPGSSHDFGKDLIPNMIQAGLPVYAYPFSGYWVDVGTIDSYWRAHMDLLRHPPVLDLNDRSWIIHTRSEERPPVLVLNGATVRDSLVTDGCVIAPGAVVERSVLSPGVYVGPEAVVRESIVLTDTSIEAGAHVERTIIDKQATIGHNARVGRIEPDVPDLGITTIGKSAQIPGNTVVGRGCVVSANVRPEDFPPGGIKDGKTLERPPFSVRPVRP